MLNYKTPDKYKKIYAFDEDANFSREGDGFLIEAEESPEGIETNYSICSDVQLEHQREAADIPQVRGGAEQSSDKPSQW